MIPNSTPQAKREDVIKKLIASKLWKNMKVTQVSIIGWRGYYLDSMGKKGQNDRGVYDDAMFVLSPDTFTAFNANVDPSVNRTGIAVLKSPQRVTYRPGHHGYNSRYGHPAFRQASDVTVIRDGQGEDTDSSRGRFWINLHRGGNSTTSSAGCQTVPPTQWQAFYNLVRLQMNRFGQTTFNYYLVG